MASKSSSVPPFSFKSEIEWKEECLLASSSSAIVTTQRSSVKKVVHRYLASSTRSSPPPRAAPRHNSACLAKKIEFFSSNDEEKANTICDRADTEVVSVGSSSNSSFSNSCSVEVNLSTTSENGKHNHYLLPFHSLKRLPSTPKSQYKSSCCKEGQLMRTEEKGADEKELPKTGLGTSRIGDDTSAVTSGGASSCFSFSHTPIASVSPSNNVLEINKKQNSHPHSQHSPVLAQDVNSDSSLGDSSLKRSPPSFRAFALHGTPPPPPSLEEADRKVNIETPVQQTVILSSLILDEDHKGAPSIGMSATPTEVASDVSLVAGATAHGEKFFLYLNGHPLLEESVPCHIPPLEGCDGLRPKKDETSSSERRGLTYFFGDHLLGGENGKDGGNEVFAEKPLSVFSAPPLSYKSDVESNVFPFPSVEEMEMGVPLREFDGDEEDQYYGLLDGEDSRKTRSWVQRLGMHGENRVHSPPPRFLMSFSSTSRFSYKAQMLRQQKEGSCSVTSAVIPSSSSLLTTTGGTRTRRHTSRDRNSTSAVEHHFRCQHSRVQPSLLRGSSSTNERNTRRLSVENLSVYHGCDSSFTKSNSKREKCEPLRKTTKRSDAPLDLARDPFSCYHRHQSRCGIHGYLCTVPQSFSGGVNSSSSTSTLINSPTCASTALGGFSSSSPFITDDVRSLRGENGDFPLQDGKLIPHCHSTSHYSFRGHVTSCCSQCNHSLHHRQCSTSRESFTSYHSVTQRALDPYEPPLDV